VVHDADKVQIGEVVRELVHALGAYERVEGADLVHDHTIGGLFTGAHSCGVPVVATNHGPFDDLLTALYSAVADRVALVGISASQVSATTLPVRVIHHGIDVDAIPVGTGQGGYALFLGRMTPEKGAHRAIQAARGAGLPLVIAAKMRESAEHEYFERCVEPLLGDDARYVGEADTDTKYRLLGGACALINPITWPEPFGMVMVESLACGTPVVGFPSGAAPEIVDDGSTGYLEPSLEGLSRALRQIDQIDRGACRAAVSQRFSLERMVADHLRLYEELLENRSKPARLVLAAGS
jgi:glycosyltransferase involved in cell wall biosynthesis